MCVSSDVSLFMTDLTLLKGIDTHANVLNLIAVCMDDNKPALGCFDGAVEYNLKRYFSEECQKDYLVSLAGARVCVCVCVCVCACACA